MPALIGDANSIERAPLLTTVMVTPASITGVASRLMRSHFMPAVKVSTSSPPLYELVPLT